MNNPESPSAIASSPAIGGIACWSSGRYFRLALVGVVLVVFAALKLSSFASPTHSSSECPSGPPGPEYLDRALVWVAERDGVAIMPNDAGPLSSPLAPNVQNFSQTTIEPAISARLRPLLGVYSIPVSRFVRDSNLDRCFAFVSITRRQPRQIDELMVDVTNLAVLKRSDLMQMRSAAPIVPSTKIEKSLRSRLAAMNDTETVPVVVWFHTEPGMDAGSLQQRAYEELVRTIPEAAENFARYGKPFGSDDSEASRYIQQEYSRLITEVAVPEAVRAASAMLRAIGVSVSTINPMPAIRARLTRQQIDEFAQQVTVETIYLAEAAPTPALGDAAASQGIDRIWGSGILGTGEKIAIIEAGNVQLANAYLSYDQYRLVSPTGEDVHSTSVAAAAASFHPDYPGTARGASILSVGVGTDPWDVIWGLSWAIGSPNYAKFVNYSWCFQPYGNLDLVGRGFDYWARLQHVFVSAASGNDALIGGGSEYVCSPANAFNVLGVGGFDNKNSPSWVDDEMYGGSNWKNPISPHSDREKPELVAVGQGLDLWGWNNSQWMVTGTSVASPQVTGLAALLANAWGNLLAQPEAARAILIASSIHNIEGSTRLTMTVDVRDGVGAIAGNHALETALNQSPSQATCHASCWWGQALVNPQPGATVNRVFQTHQGQRVRVAIWWWSTATSAPYDNDVLDIDLDLYVYDPFGLPAADGVSTSYDNNYELVDFIAPANGIYTIEILNAGIRGQTVPDNYVGIAVVLPTYRVYMPIAER